MGKESNYNEELERARNAVPRKDIIVDWATIVCSNCGKDDSVYFRIADDAHGVSKDRSIAAHDGDCVADKNIEAFPYCASPTYLETMEELKSSATDGRKAIYKEAYNKTKNKAQRSARESCVLPLLDRWFEPDEKYVVTSLIDFESFSRVELVNLQAWTEPIMKNAEITAYDACSLGEYNENPDKAKALAKEREDTYDRMVSNRNTVKENLKSLRSKSENVEMDMEELDEITKTLDDMKNILADTKTKYENSYDYYSSKKSLTDDEKEKDKKIRDGFDKLEGEIKDLRKAV